MSVKIRTRGLKKSWGLSKTMIRRASLFAAEIAKKPDLEIVYHAIFVDDETITRYHADYLNDPTPTDVISFHMEEIDPHTGEYLLGDLIISFETAEREAKKRKSIIAKELLLYTVHGFLHLLGYEDNTPSSKKQMDTIQQQVLKRIFK